VTVVQPDLPPAAAAFTTRGGGVSEGPYATLNLAVGSGDDAARVGANDRRLADLLGFSAAGLVRLRQVHGAEVAVVERPAQGDRPLEAFDAAVTDQPGVVLLVLAADCAPVLLVDPRRPAVGAVHAGWRGVVADAPGAAVRRMVEAFGSRPAALRAAIGPCISSCCYEVDALVAERFAEAGLPFEDQPAEAAVDRRSSEARIARPSADREGKPRWRLDLVAAVRARLVAAGLAPPAIDAAGLCTACRPDLFFSHRRDGAGTGRQAGLSWLPRAPDRGCGPRRGHRPKGGAGAEPPAGGVPPTGRPAGARAFGPGLLRRPHSRSGAGGTPTPGSVARAPGDSR
jgi:YfiH family protein